MALSQKLSFFSFFFLFLGTICMIIYELSSKNLFNIVYDVTGKKLYKIKKPSTHYSDSTLGFRRKSLTSNLIDEHFLALKENNMISGEKESYRRFSRAKELKNNEKLVWFAKSSTNNQVDKKSLVQLLSLYFDLSDKENKEIRSFLQYYFNISDNVNDINDFAQLNPNNVPSYIHNFEKEMTAAKKKFDFLNFE